jgi:rubrerythrin
MEMDPITAAKYLEKSTPILCEACGHNTFQEQIMLRKLSKFFTATDKDSLIPIPVFVCGKCGHINKDMIPPQLLGAQKSEPPQTKTNDPVMKINKDDVV